ncbi:MAG: hypothetical protein FWD79_05070 [Desulfobulbus sp.]|nr:hypothetical protein [Desulfobulbus sp.]
MRKAPAKPDSMEQVRELLLGTQMKDVENRFQRLEERFQQNLSDLRDSVKNRIESLESFMKSESTSFLHRLREEQEERSAALKNEQRERLDAFKMEKTERQEALKNEQRERSEGLAQVTRDLATLEQEQERKLKALSGTLDAAERELRQLLLSENARLSDKVEQKYKDALNILAKTAAQIRHDMATRSQISSLLTEMAVKLSGQWTDTASASVDAEMIEEENSEEYSESSE